MAASRYGEGSESFEETQRKFAAQESLRKELERKGAVENANAKQADRITQEEEALARREAAAQAELGRARGLDVSATEEQVAARRRNIASMTEEEALLKRHQALQQGLAQTRLNYSRTIATEGIPGGAQLAAQEAEIRRRMGLVEREMQMRGMSAPPPPGAVPFLANEDPNRMRQLTAGTSTLVGGPGGVQRVQESAPATGREEAVRRVTAETQKQVAASRAAGEAAQWEAVKQRELAAADAELAVGAGAASAKVREQAVATRESAVAFSALDTSMYRHGALTTEFISAAARGEVTLRDLGTQVGQTTAKFAGWTAAAGLVYGAYRAIKDFGTGAVETQNAVQNLSRFIETGFDTSRAKEQLQSLAEETNVPIKEVGDAASQFARVFHNQDQAFQAARASILLTKLDNLSTADSYKALTATVQGFHLEAKDIPGLMDSINASQREFGANVSQITAGIGRAAGPMNLSNPGDPNAPQFTQALLATIIRTTGGQGANVGIALARAATRFVRTPKSVETLAGYGIDANQNFDAVIQQSFSQIQKRQLGNQDINKISQAIGGPAFGARYFSGLFQNQELFEKILKDTSPERVKGTATEELQKKLHSFSEEAKSVGVNLQVLGSRLEEAGVFDPILAGVKALAEMVKVGADVVGTFAHLPPVLRESLLVITAMVATSRVLGRFGGIGGLVSRVPGLGEVGSSDAVMQRRIAAGLRTQRSAAYSSAERAARSGVDASVEAEAAAIRAADFRTENAAALAGRNGMVQQVAAEEELAKLDVARDRAINAGNEAKARVIAAQRIAQRTDQELAEITGARASEAAAIAARQGYPITVGGQKPNTAGIQYLGGRGVVDPKTGGYFPPVAGGEAIPMGEGIAGEGKQAASRARQFIDREASALRVGVSSVAQEWGAALAVFGPAGAIGSAAKTGLESAERAAQAGIRAGEAAAVAGVGLAAKVRTMLATNIMSMNGLIGVFIAYSLIAPEVEAAQKRQQQASDALQNASTPDQIAAASRASLHTPNALQRTGLFFTHPQEYGRSLAEQSQGPVIQAALRDEALTRATLQANEAREGKPVIDQTAAQLSASATKQFADYKAGRITLSQLQADFAKHMTELQISQFLSGSDVTDVKGLLARLSAEAGAGKGKTYGETIAGLGSKDLTALTTATLRDLKAFGTGTKAGRDAMAHLSAQLQRAETLALNTGSDADVNAFAQAQETITSGIKSQVEADLQLALGTARNEKERQAAYRQAIQASHALIAGPDAVVSQSRQALDNAESGLKNARDKLAKARRQAPAPPHNALTDSLGALGTTGPFGPGADPLGNARIDPKAQQAAVEAYTKEVSHLKGRLKNARDYREQALKEYRAEVLGFQQQAAQEHVQGLQLQGQIAAARANTPEGEQSATLNAAQNVLQYVRSHPKLFSVQDEGNALLAVLQAKKAIRDQAHQNQEQLIQLQGELAQARDDGDASAQARDAQNTARRLLAVAKTPQEKGQAQLALVQANNQARQAAQDIVSARFEYLESLTQDPLKRDRLTIQGAQADVRNARGTAERYRALAKVNQAKQTYVQDRISGRESDVQFQLDMGQITTSQAEADLQALLKIRGLTKQQKQEIQLRIHQLKQTADQEASGFGMDVGSIKMPTVYDVRRAMGGVRDSIRLAKAGVTPIVANNTTNITVKVTDPKAAHKVYDEIDRAAKTHLRATMRTAGMRRG